MEKENKKEMFDKNSLSSEAKYIFLIAYYFMIAQMFLLIFIMPLLSKVVNENDDTLAYDNVIAEVLYDKYGMTMVDQQTYDKLLRDYKVTGIASDMSYQEYRSYDLIDALKYDDYYVIINSYNDAFMSVTENNMLKRAFIESILAGNTSHFSEDVKLRFYVANTSNIPDPLLNSRDHLGSAPFKLVSVQAPAYSSALNFVYFIILLVPMIFMLKHELLGDLKAFKTLDKENIIFGVAILFATSIGLGLVSNLLKGLMILPPGISANQRAIESMLVFPSAIFMITAAVILGPLVEEIVFRHLIFKLIKNPYAALIISSLVFGLVHVLSEPNLLYGIAQGISYVGLGVVLGFIYLKNQKNLTTVFIIHALYNGLSVILTLI